MKALTVLFSLAMAHTSFAAVNYSNQVWLSSTAKNVKVNLSEITHIPSRTEVRQIPGCIPGGEAGQICEETIVVQSVEAIRVELQYEDSQFSSDDNQYSYSDVYFKLSDFSADQIELLRSVYPAWKHPFSNVTRKFAREHFALSVQEVKRPFQVIDMSKSKLCSVNSETGEKLNPSCEDVIVYKDSWTYSVLATVLKK